MTQNDIVSILTDILDLTQKNQVRWTVTSTEDQFMVAIGNASIAIDRFMIEDDPVYYTLRIYNSKGNVVYSHNSFEDGNITISSLIEKIYMKADNFIYKRDETIQSIKNTLKELKKSQTEN